MKALAQMPGQFSGQVPNQAGSQLADLPQQNGNLFHTLVQNSLGQSNPIMMDPEQVKIRRFVRQRIYETLMLSQPQPDEIISRKCHDMSRRLEDRLFNLATTKDEYVNMDTLESRLQSCVKRPAQTDLPQQNRNPFHMQVQNSAGQSNPIVMNPELVKLRRYMRERIYETLMLSQPQPDEIISGKCHDMSRRLEDRLFNVATTKDEYANMDTLESRLQSFVEQPAQTDLPQQNGNPLHMQVKNSAGQSSTIVMNPELVNLRRYVRQRIYETLMLSQSQPDEIVSRKCHDISKRLEKRLFNLATTKEEYANWDTLESRLQSFVKRHAQTNQVPQHSKVVYTSTPVGTMVLTPGMQQLNLNSSVMESSTVDLDLTLMTLSTE